MDELNKNKRAYDHKTHLFDEILVKLNSDMGTIEQEAAEIANPVEVRNLLHILDVISKKRTFEII